MEHTEKNVHENLVIAQILPSLSDGNLFQKQQKQIKHVEYVVSIYHWKSFHELMVVHHHHHHHPHHHHHHHL